MIKGLDKNLPFPAMLNIFSSIAVYTSKTNKLRGPGITRRKTQSLTLSPPWSNFHLRPSAAIKQHIINFNFNRL